MIEIFLYYGGTKIGDINAHTSSRMLSEYLKSEASSTICDQLTFSVYWKKFKDFIATRFDDNPAEILRVGKTRVVMLVDGRVRFSGYLAARPARIGSGADQVLSLRFFEHFARLSGDVVCSESDKTSPMRVFKNRPAHLYVKDLINEFMARANAAGETLNWSYGTVNALNNKTHTYKDFQTVSKALCDAMNNTRGAGKFDVVFRADPNDYTRQIIDILKPRGRDKNIIIKFPGDGVYELWSSDYSVEESDEYASELIVSGSGQVGDSDIGENTAPIATASNSAFVSDYCYFRRYDSKSNLTTSWSTQEYADTALQQMDFGLQTPEIELVGRPIAWGDSENMDNGLAVGDSFFFLEESDDGTDNSGQMRIVSMETVWDSNGIESVKPKLKRLGF